MNKLKYTYLLVFLALPGLISVPASPSTVMKLTLSQLVKKSDAIVIGTIVAQESMVKGDLVYTRNTASIENTLSGTAAGTVDIVTLGGSRGDGISLFVFGEARFTVGERFIAFLTLQNGAWRVLGMAQGKMRIEEDEASGRPMVIPPDPVNLVSVKSGKLAKDKPFMTEAVPLEAFIQDLLWEKDGNGP
jgi:hypothetical protein